jgi:hypothetical protein
MPATIAAATAETVTAEMAAAAALEATIATVTAASVGAYSSIQQGKAAEQAGKYNAELAARQAENIKEASEYEEREARIEGRKLRARQLVQFAKGGVVPGAGTPLLVQEETAARTERDIMLQKYGYGQQYVRSLSEAKMQRMMGKSKSRASRWQAGSSLLTGAYRAASIYA